MSKYSDIKVYIKDFRELEVYKKAYLASISVHNCTKSFPKDEKFSMSDQVRRASRSICANIAEGYAKQIYSKAEFRRFLQIAHGSSNEMLVWGDFCKDFGYITKDIHKVWNHEYTGISMMLNKLSISIK